MSVFWEFVNELEEKKRRLARQQRVLAWRQRWEELRGPVSTQTFLIAAAALLALGSFLGGVIAAARLAGR